MSRHYQLKNPLKQYITRFQCWWFGCLPDYSKAIAGRETPCARCGDGVGYGDLLGNTRHSHFKKAVKHWLFRKWWPAKCPDCGHRYKCNDEIDHIPF